MFRRFIVYSFAALFFFTPLVLWPGNFEVFEFNKMLVVYLFAGLIVSLWAIRMIIERKLIFHRTPLDLPLLLFFASQIISTVVSINLHTSLWGYYSRFHGGLFSIISYLFLYYAFVSNLNKKDLPVIKYSLLGSATLVSLYGVAQHFGVDKHIWVQDVQNRIFSTLGQPNWLSAYLIALLPISLFAAVNSKNKINSLCYLLLTTLFLFTIWFTKSQSGLFATAIIVAAIAIYQLSRKSKLIYLLVIPLLLVAVYSKRHLLPLLSPFANPNLNQQVQEDLNNRYGGSDSMVIRQVVWQGARDLFVRRPLFGTGVETFGYSYYWTRPAAHNLLSEWDFLYNKAHNEYLNFLATTGAFGLLSYLVLSSTILYLLYKNGDFDYLFGIGSILITNYFGFSVVPIALFFYLYPALSITSTSSSPSSVEGDVSHKTKQKAYASRDLSTEQYLLIAVIAVAFSYWCYFIVNRWSADLKFNQGKQYSDAGYVGHAIPYLESAVSIYPGQPLFRSTLAESYASAAFAISQQFAALPPDQQEQLSASYLNQRDQFANKSLSTIDGVIKDNPYHLNFYKSQAKINLTLAAFDSKYNQAALNALLSANELAPTDAKILYNIGLIQLELGQIDQARVAFQKAIELKSDYFSAQLQLDLLK